MEDKEIYEVILSTTNMMRGMIMDPAIPEHAKSAMRNRIDVLEAALSEMEDEL